MVRKSGLVLFIICFGLFNLSPFLEQYSLNRDNLEKIMTDPAGKLFSEEAGNIFDKVYPTTFSLIRDINTIFEQVNEKQLKRYGITPEEVEALVSTSEELTFSFALLDKIYPGEGEINTFKKQRFKDFGNWLEGQAFSTSDEMVDALWGVAETIRTWGIINVHGFDRYKQKSLRYEMVRSASQGPVSSNPLLFFMLCFGLGTLGALLYILPVIKTLPGIKNNGVFLRSHSSRGWLGILLGSWLIAFYIVLYFYHEYMTTWIIMVDPVSFFLKKSEASQFFLYGVLYTLAVLVMGLRMIIKYRHSNYQLFRTASVMFFQLGFAFLIPEILLRLNKPYFDFKNIWPLDYDFFFDYELDNMLASGGLGIFMLGWGIALILIGVPIFTYFFGKRWYCSWVCGCGGLAETLGDPFRQLSDKRLKAWKIERIIIHFVLFFAIVMTAGVLYTWFTGQGNVFGVVSTYTVREIYGLLIGSAFAGVVGTGFYPLMGNRVWCRFGCPLAAYLGIVQRFKSRFRITTNGGQCISCGNCSTYCEMGIDVRWYAQRGQNIVRASCVGCGVCSSVCPRGVLKLETKEERGRIH